MPGAYQYKFACYDWAASEDMPAECSDPINDGYNNRYVEVPVEPGDFYETDVARWGTCPPEPCELFDCNNLHFAFHGGFIDWIYPWIIYELGNGG